MVFDWTKRSHTKESREKRAITYAKTMAVKKAKRAKEKGAWYCQSCGEKHYRSDAQFVVCEKCFAKIKGQRRQFAKEALQAGYDEVTKTYSPDDIFEWLKNEGK